MRKCVFCMVIVLFTHLGALSAHALNIFKQYKKVIWIDQIKQIGAAYEQGDKICEFPIITGDDETPTSPGIYVVRVKDENYFSRKYDTPMSYSIFFDFKGKRAIHEGEVPGPELKKELATHGCIHVEQPYIEELFDWTEEGKTVVVIHGARKDN
jgi:lipoprotein-anchoring transpeptidase ErfK/SrfK